MTTATAQSISFRAAETGVKAPSFAAVMAILLLVNLRDAESDLSSFNAAYLA
jgi:hypothetical protein